MLFRRKPKLEGLEELREKLRKATEAWEEYQNYVEDWVERNKDGIKQIAERVVKKKWGAKVLRITLYWDDLEPLRFHVRVWVDKERYEEEKEVMMKIKEELGLKDFEKMIVIIRKEIEPKEKCKKRSRKARQG